MKIGVSLPVRELGPDIAAIVEFARLAEDLGFSHLRIPDQVIREKPVYAHEPLTLLCYIAAVTRTIELVPSIIVTPSRQTVLLAKQAAELDVLSGGRLRLGIGVGSNELEYQLLGEDFSTRGARADEQIKLLKDLWTSQAVEFRGAWHHIQGAGISPLPVQGHIPLWIGARPLPAATVRQRIGQHADGWFVLASPDQFDGLKADIDAFAQQAGRDPQIIGTEAGVAVIGPRQAEWKGRVRGWHTKGLTHLCLRTLGGGLDAKGHLSTLRQAATELDGLLTG